MAFLRQDVFGVLPIKVGSKVFNIQWNSAEQTFSQIDYILKILGISWSLGVPAGETKDMDLEKPPIGFQLKTIGQYVGIPVDRIKPFFFVSAGQKLEPVLELVPIDTNIKIEELVR